MRHIHGILSSNLNHRNTICEEIHRTRKTSLYITTTTIPMVHPFPKSQVTTNKNTCQVVYPNSQEEIRYIFLKDQVCPSAKGWAS